jgi:hypothetical protein
MRSLWRNPGRHVVVSRDQNRWQGFADVTSTASGKLLATYCDGRAHGGGGKSVLRTSDDGGKTWSPEVVITAAKGANERLQRLRDGSLLLVSGEKVPTAEFKRSTDDGRTWTTLGRFDCRDFGLKVHYALSHVLECSDGSWLTVGSDTFPIGEQAFDHANRFRIHERLQVYRSADTGKTWTLGSVVDTFPSSGHAGSEASIHEIGGRLIIYARDSRNDGYPGFRVYSSDFGKTWSEPEDLPIQVIGRVGADLLADGRVMLTTRTEMGYSGLWAWIDDPANKPGFQIGGIHFNDHSSKGLRGGVLYIENDGHRGQFTRYLLRPPEGPESAIVCEAEVLVRENGLHAATIGIPFAGQLRIFPDRVDFAGTAVHSIRIAPGKFHTYRITASNGQPFRLAIDGEVKLETSDLDGRTWKNGWSPAIVSTVSFAFGNYPSPDVHPPDANAGTHIRPEQITPQVTGLSLWKRVRSSVTGRGGRVFEISWDASRDGFPDQYQLDHVIRIDASVSGFDQGYSSWTELPDGRIFVINYTDDGAVAWPATGTYAHCPWIRGTFLNRSDLL